MNKREEQKFIEIMMGLGEYYGRTISEFLIDQYLDGLSEFSIDDIYKAVKLHMKNPDGGQYMPKISDIIRHLSGSNNDTALEAWTKVDRAVRTIGPNRSIVFDDAIIHVVISDMGGWIRFGEMDYDQWPFTQNEFVKRYKNYANVGGCKKYLSKLLGIHDMHNRQIGKETSRETVLVGNQKEAMKVLAGGLDKTHLDVKLLSEIIESGSNNSLELLNDTELNEVKAKLDEISEKRTQNFERLRKELPKEIVETDDDVKLGPKFEQSFDDVFGDVQPIPALDNTSGNKENTVKLV